MPLYSQKLKDSIIRKMMPLLNHSVARISRDSGITMPTLYG